MIIAKLQGGLGNQMFQYALGRALGLKHQTKLLLDARQRDSKNFRSYDLHAFNIEENLASPEDIKKVKTVKESRMHYFDPQILDAGPDIYLDGHWQSEKYFKDIAEVLRKEFTLKNPPSPALESLLAKVSSTNSISLHIRRTDYLQAKHQRIYEEVPLSYYEEAVKKIRETSRQGGLEIFVFSDDIEWVKNNLKIDSGIPMTFVSDKGLTPQEELYLMRACKHNIIANSSFSWWGAWLNANPEKIVIAPKRWFVESYESNDNDLVPESWIRIAGKPKVSVLMSVYNGEKYLREAIESILYQSFTNFEFIIINDGSKDTSAEIIKSYSDERIIFVSNDGNKGLPYSLNRGLDMVQGEFIARMDADDISLPNRLAKQVEFMKRNPDITACGSWISTIGGKAYTHKHFTDPEDIKASLLFNTSMTHPSVMMRKTDIDRLGLHYGMNFKFFEEDYALWIEISKKGKLLANIPEVLLKYRIHEKSVTKVNTENRKEGVSMLRQKQLEALGLKPTAAEMAIHNSLVPLLGHEEWFTKILEANKTSKVYAEDSLSKIIYMRWKTVCGMNAKDGVIAWKTFVASPLYRDHAGRSFFDSLKLLVKSIVKVSR